MPCATTSSEMPLGRDENGHSRTPCAAASSGSSTDTRMLRSADDRARPSRGADGTRAAQSSGADESTTRKATALGTGATMLSALSGETSERG